VSRDEQADVLAAFREVRRAMGAAEPHGADAALTPDPATDGRLAVRFGHLTSHLANYLNELQYMPGRRGDLGQALREAVLNYRWAALQHRAVLRRSGTHRLFEERHATVVQAWAEIANQYRGAAEAWASLSRLGAVPRSEGRISFLRSAEQMEMAWHRARAALGTAERLPNLFRSSIAATAASKTLGRRSGDVGPAVAELFNEYLREAEIHRRTFADGGADADQVRLAKDAARLLEGLA
jgi:hypothetical protein